MKGALARWLENSDGTLLWIELEAYARRTFGGERAAFFGNAAAYGNALGQAAGLLRSAVITLDASEPFLEAASHDGRNPVERCRLAFSAPAPLLMLAERIEATKSRAAGRDIALAVPAPADLLRRFGAPPEATPDADDIDDVASVLAQTLRSLSASSLAAVVLVTDADSDRVLVEAEPCDALVSAIRYYGWPAVWRLGRRGSASAGQLDGDVVLLGSLRFEELEHARTRGSGPRLGGGLDQRFWRGEAGDPPSGLLLYGEPPSDVAPERILECIAGLTGTARIRM